MLHNSLYVQKMVVPIGVHSSTLYYSSYLAVSDSPWDAVLRNEDFLRWLHHGKWDAEDLLVRSRLRSGEALKLCSGGKFLQFQIQHTIGTWIITKFSETSLKILKCVLTIIKLITRLYIIGLHIGYIWNIHYFLFKDTTSKMR